MSYCIYAERSWTWAAALIGTDSMNFESDKFPKKVTHNTFIQPASGIFLGEIHFTWPQVKCLEWSFSTAARCKFTQSLRLRHKTILYPVTLINGGGQMGNPCLPSTKMPWLSDSSQTQKWNKSIVASLMEKTKTTAQHDNDQKSTQALRLPPERHLFKWM